MSGIFSGSRRKRRLGLTLFGRSLLLMSCELAANAICWTVAAILFARNGSTRSRLGLALLAWTLGLRHVPMREHVPNCNSRSAIDNATRNLINLNLGRLPVTCGLFFSLGHSTIVIIVTVAIAISSSVYERINGVGEVGGIIGAAVSGSFLFIIGVANTIILTRILRQRQRGSDQLLDRRRANGEVIEEVEARPEENHMIMMRILGPVINFVDRPWKMYPVGVLFGLGFDTASSIALLGVSALAKNTSGGTSIPSSHIIILPLLFTAGMTMIDSADSVLMLYSYAGFPERSFAIFSWTLPSQEKDTGEHTGGADEVKEKKDTEEKIAQATSIDTASDNAPVLVLEVAVDEEKAQDPQTKGVVAVDNATKARTNRTKTNVMSGLSIVLTLLSICLAFSISLITIMGLIGENCATCVEAAEAEDGGGLAGSWWRGWANAGEQSGWIGIAIVGTFLVVIVGWYGGRWVRRRMTRTGEAPKA